MSEIDDMVRALAPNVAARAHFMPGGTFKPQPGTAGGWPLGIEYGQAKPLGEYMQEKTAEAKDVFNMPIFKHMQINPRSWVAWLESKPESQNVQDARAYGGPPTPARRQHWPYTLNPVDKNIDADRVWENQTAMPLGDLAVQAGFYDIGQPPIPLPRPRPKAPK